VSCVLVCEFCSVCPCLLGQCLSSVLYVNVGVLPCVSSFLCHVFELWHVCQFVSFVSVQCVMSLCEWYIGVLVVICVPVFEKYHVSKMCSVRHVRV
jgi:hypothetical protein